jgi:hypothetical protein
MLKRGTTVEQQGVNWSQLLVKVDEKICKLQPETKTLAHLQWADTLDGALSGMIVTEFPRFLVLLDEEEKPDLSSVDKFKARLMFAN